MSESEVAKLRQRIAEEYQSAQLGMTGLASGVSKHQFITARMNNLGQSFDQLTELVGSPQEAMKLVVEEMESAPDTETRSDMLDVLRHELGDSQETEILIDWLLDMWETMDLLVQRFGERAHKIIHVPACETRNPSPIPSGKEDRAS